MKILYLPNQYSQQRQREKKRWVYPVLLAMEAQYYREQGHEVYWNEHHDPPYEGEEYKVISEPEGLPFFSLPTPDREWTNAKDPRYQQNGNFKYRPGTYIIASSGCWYRKCAFCVERNKDIRTRNLHSVLKEIRECGEQGYREVFDDSGTFPIGAWLQEFCRYRKGVAFPKISCNMRIGTGIDYDMLKNAGFRMLLYGVESANQRTLDKLNKGVNAYEIVPEIIRASKAGLDPHIAVMFGYPWESAEEESRTLKLVHYLLRKGYAKTAQASLYNVQGVKAIDRGNVKRIYACAKFPTFWYRKLLSLKRWDDVTYLCRGIKEGLRRD